MVRHRVRSRLSDVRSVRARVGFQRGGGRVAVRRIVTPRAGGLRPARVAPMLIAISVHVFTSWRFRVIVYGRAEAAAPP